VTLSARDGQDGAQEAPEAPGRGAAHSAGTTAPIPTAPPGIDTPSAADGSSDAQPASSGGGGDRLEDTAPLGRRPPRFVDDKPAAYSGAAQGEEPPAERAAVGERPVLEAVVVFSTGELRERAGVGVFRRAARSPNTLLAYQRDWDRFFRWCGSQGVVAFPAEAGVVASYLAEAANARDLNGRSAPWRYSPATLERWASTINKAHDLSGLVAPGKDPEVREVLAGVRRVRASPPHRKSPLLLADLERILTGIEVKAWPQAPGGIRNRCLLVMGWVGAFRRDELVQLENRDITLHPEDGLHVHVRVSKTDPEAQGRIYALPYSHRPLLCAPCAWLRWRQVVNAWDGTDGGPGRRAGVIRTVRAVDPDQHLCRSPQPAHLTTSGARSENVFRAVKANGAIGGPINGEGINQVVKRTAKAVGFDPERIGGHSLRAGFVTQAFRNGATAHAIMRQTGHADPKTLEIYARETAPLVGNAVTQLGL
jgi:integrase